MNQWDEIIEGMRPVMEKMHGARESALKDSRLLIQTCSKCIRHIHRHQFDVALELLAQAKAIARTARENVAPYPEVMYAGYLQDAEKELVEAAAVLAIVRDEPLPDPTELGVQPASYLNGMGEAASECRRYLLDEMRKGSMDKAEQILGQMETIYDDLITFDYPDSLTGGLRRTCDALRAVIERTRSDLTMTRSQQELLEELRRAPIDPHA